MSLNFELNLASQKYICSCLSGFDVTQVVTQFQNNRFEIASLSVFPLEPYWDTYTEYPDESNMEFIMHIFSYVNRAVQDPPHEENKWQPRL